MRHRLPHALTADGSFIFSLEGAISSLVARLYGGLPLPASPQSQATPKQVKRNAEIRARYAEGTSVPDLAREYSISTKRVSDPERRFRIHTAYRPFSLFGVALPDLLYVLLAELCGRQENPVEHFVPVEQMILP